MKKSEKLYRLFRKARDLEDSLRELSEESLIVGNAIKTAERLGNEIFECVGKEAAYEIDNEYFDKQEQRFRAECLGEPPEIQPTLF